MQTVSQHVLKATVDSVQQLLHWFMSFAHCDCGGTTVTFPWPIWFAFQMKVAPNNVPVQADAGVQFSHCSPMINQEEIS